LHLPVLLYTRRCWICHGMILGPSAWFWSHRGHYRNSCGLQRLKWPRQETKSYLQEYKRLCRVDTSSIRSNQSYLPWCPIYVLCIPYTNKSTLEWVTVSIGHLLPISRPAPGSRGNKEDLEGFGEIYRHRRIIWLLPSRRVPSKIHGKFLGGGGWLIWQLDWEVGLLRRGWVVCMLVGDESHLPLRIEWMTNSTGLIYLVHSLLM